MVFYFDGRNRYHLLLGLAGPVSSLGEPSPKNVSIPREALARQSYTFCQGASPKKVSNPFLQDLPRRNIYIYILYICQADIPKCDVIVRSFVRSFVLFGRRRGYVVVLDLSSYSFRGLCPTKIFTLEGLQQPEKGIPQTDSPRKVSTKPIAGERYPPNR